MPSKVNKKKKAQNKAKAQRKAIAKDTSGNGGVGQASTNAQVSDSASRASLLTALTWISPPICFVCVKYIDLVSLDVFAGLPLQDTPLLHVHA